MYGPGLRSQQTPLFSLEEKVPPSPQPLDWEPKWGRVSNRALDPQNLLRTHPSVGSGCDCDPFGILLQYKSTRKRLCNNFREGGNRAFTADWETIKRLARVPASKEGRMPQPDTASSEPRCSVEKTELSSLLLQPLFPGGFTIFSPVFRGGH